MSYRLLFLAFSMALSNSSQADGYADLVNLFHEWRTFEKPPLRDGAPDYTAPTLAAAHQNLQQLQRQLQAIDSSAWPVEQQVDWHLVRAEMNGFDFNYRILRPWARDPAFYQTVWTYQSDTPAHEGPTHHALLELWTYEFPLTPAEQSRMATQLAVIPPLLAQARGNLTGNARDLWITGIENIRTQGSDLAGIASQLPTDAAPQLREALAAARSANESFLHWLEDQADSKTGPSGVGKADYTWYLRQVHYVPLSWDEEVTLLKRELDRAWSSLKLEEHRNRHLPQLVSIESAAEYDRRANQSVTDFMRFLDEGGLLPVPDYYDQALRERIGNFVPKETRNFFWTAVHFEPTTLWTHFYHWFDLADMREKPHSSPIRRGPLLYNIFDSRAEGMATGFEEMTLNAGLYDNNPRAREIVYIMLAQRAARGLGSLAAHANEKTMGEAAEYHVKWTPRSWMRKDLDLLAFEQQLYMRQPGYGSSYITGKYLIEQLMAEQAEALGDKFVMAEFFDQVNRAGVIPVALIRWQLTGQSDQIDSIMADQGDL